MSGPSFVQLSYQGIAAFLDVRRLHRGTKGDFAAVARMFALKGSCSEVSAASSLQASVVR